MGSGLLYKRWCKATAQQPVSCRPKSYIECGLREASILGRDRTNQLNLVIWVIRLILIWQRIRIGSPYLYWISAYKYTVERLIDKRKPKMCRCSVIVQRSYSVLIDPCIRNDNISMLVILIISMRKCYLFIMNDN